MKQWSKVSFFLFFKTKPKSCLPQILLVHKKYILKFHFVYTIYKIYIIQTQSASPNVDLSLKSFLWNRLFQKWLSLNILAIWRQEAIRKLGCVAFSHLCPSRASQRLSLPIMAPPRGRSRARSGFVPLLSYHGRIVHPAHFSYLYLYIILSHLVLLIVLLPLKNYPPCAVSYRSSHYWRDLPDSAL